MCSIRGEKVVVYEIHCSNLAGGGEVGSSCIGVRQFGDNFSAIIHGEQEDFVILAFRQFHNFHARFCANGAGSKLTQLRDVELHVAVRELCAFSPEPSP